MEEPRKTIQDIEDHGRLPAGPEERFPGYGVMGLPFASGHLLCLRRFPVSLDDPRDLVVSSMWQKREDWERWRASAPRQDLERKFAEILDRPSRYEHYALGFPGA